MNTWELYRAIARQAEPNECFVLNVGDIFGTVWLHIVEKMPNPVDEPESYGYITNFFVRDGVRGRGIGTTLLEWRSTADPMHAQDH